LINPSARLPRFFAYKQAILFFTICNKQSNRIAVTSLTNRTILTVVLINDNQYKKMKLKIQFSVS